MQIKYYFKNYKIACANVEYGSVLQFLRTKHIGLPIPHIQIDLSVCVG